MFFNKVLSYLWLANVLLKTTNKTFNNLIMTIFIIEMTKNNVNEIITSFFFFDKFSLMLMMMTTLIYFSINLIKTKKYFQFNIKTTLFLFWCLLMTFFSTSMLGFYIFFEMSLIPLMYIILNWGYQPERIQAFFYLVYYTLLSSFPLLSILIFMKNIINNKWIMLNFSNSYNFSSFWNVMIYLLYSSMLIKLPMYFWHLWLPKAHVEAPVMGSMILASVLLKISGYGVYRLSVFFIYFYKINMWLLATLMMSAIYSSLICLQQTDLKSLIAYSSISHMSLMMLGLMLFYSNSNKSSLMLMVTHGFCSSMMFYMANFFYEQMNSRQLNILRNLNFLNTSLWMWVVYLILNFSIPPSLSFYSEMMLIVNLSQTNMVYMTLVLAAMFIVASFNVYVLSSVIHNNQYGFMSMSTKQNKIYLLNIFYLYYLLLPSLCMYTFWQ